MKNQAPKAATLKDISAAKTSPAAKTETAEEKKSKRIMVKFIAADKQQLASPSIDVMGIGLVHNPEDGKLPSQSWTLGAKALAEFPALVMQLALFGASVHLRNQINTEKDEAQARANLEARLDGFKKGIYRAQSEGTESVPLVMQALRLALVAAGGFTDEVIEEKMTRQLRKWHDGDKTEKATIRSSLMANPAVSKAFAELSVKAAKPATEVVDLGAL